MLNKYKKFIYKLSKFIYPENIHNIKHAHINGYNLLVFANEDVGRQIYYLGFYEIAETNYFNKHIESDFICMDIGGNIGYFSMLMAKNAKAGCVHIFEPIELNASLLKVSAELNQYKNLTLNQCAVGDEDGEVLFSQSLDSAYSSIIDTNRKVLDKVYSVPLVKLDSYIEQVGLPRVDVLKVDVEGAEEMVILGASKLLNDLNRRPKFILMELYDGNLNAFNSSVDSVIAKMNQFEYDPFVIDNNSLIRPFSIEMKANYYNVLFIPKKY